ncbi:hypothetical protein GDO81_020800 [Engystomops pustulosus]|uniref:Uncharacterized protein n=1 Tax=Engystomops pustulosus TaxID=76066 RepID=A0AAV6ZK86_ENGPU|nr:hypothetical protein GDO81_020800 [Engystomops pustulosus]
MKLAFKVLYQQPSLLDEIPETDRQTFRDLLDLLRENESPTNTDPGAGITIVYTGLHGSHPENPTYTDVDEHVVSNT